MTPDPAPRENDDGRPLQDVIPAHCFGCGALNERGLRIKSRWEGDDFVCRWQPQPEHIGYPGYVYGGTIASVVDCHAIWAAVAQRCRDTGHDLRRDGPTPWSYVTGRLTISYLQPALIDTPLELRARVVDAGERKSVVECRVLQGDATCASAELVAVRVKSLAAPPAAG